MDHTRLAADAALDLLSKCINDLGAFDDSGLFDESDLLHAVGRLQKIVGVLVPVTRRAAYLEQIDNALRVTAAERKNEALVAHVLPGPFLENRAKRLIHIAEGLRDDFRLGRLSRAQSSIQEPALAKTTPTGASGRGLVADRNTHARISSVGGESEAPPFVKWVIWVRANLRSHPGWAILGLCAIVLTLSEPIVRSYWASHSRAAGSSDERSRAAPIAPDSTQPATPVVKPDAYSCLEFLGSSRTLMASATLIDQGGTSPGHVLGDGKQVDTLEITVERMSPEMARFTGHFVNLHAHVMNESLVGALDGGNFSYEHTFELAAKGSAVTEKAEGRCSKSAMRGLVKTTLTDPPSPDYASEIVLTK